MSKPNLTDVQRTVLRWYRAHARDLPWRRTRDPYKILVSEVMLQQTQVERVIPKYRAFLRRFPTLRSLARAGLSEVVREWVGLGYNLRARRLWDCARAVALENGGRLPASEPALSELPGLGAYTAAAVACFGFGQQLAVVDTNVRRVLGRALLGRDNIAIAKAWTLAKRALPANAPAWNQALMDIGALFCRKTPRCGACPVRPACAWAATRAGLKSGIPHRSRSRNAGYNGSRRQHRGRAIKALAAAPSLSLLHLGPQVKADWGESDLPWLKELLRDLARDGLVVLERRETRARLA